MGYVLELEPPFVVIGPPMSEEELYAACDEDSDWELLDGRVVMHSPASIPHEDLFGLLLFLLRGYVGERLPGSVYGSRYPMRLDPHWSPEPDILFVSAKRKHLLKRKCLEGPADFVLEIVSESAPEIDYDKKRRKYQESGVREIWLVDPQTKAVTVDVLRGAHCESRALSAGQLSSAVISGFWIDVGRLWQEELPPPLGCLRGILGS